MDAFDGDSDLSEVSAPPTPGPAATPRATSPEASPAEAVKSETVASVESPQPTNKQRSSRRGLEAEPAAELPTLAPTTTRKKNVASTSSLAEPSATTTKSDNTSASKRRTSARDRKAPAKLRPPSPTVEAAKESSRASSSTEAPNARLKVKFKGRSSADESGFSRGATPQTTSAIKVTLKVGGHRKKLADDLRGLADDYDDEKDADEDAHPEDDFVPDGGAAGSKDAADDEKPTIGKRDRNARNKVAGRRRAIVADDEEDEDAGEEGAPKPPQRKRAKLSDTGPAGSGKDKGRSARGGKKAVNYSDDDDEDEEMVDAASDEEDLEDAAALDTDDEFDEADGPSRGGKSTRKGKAGVDVAKKAGGRAVAMKSSTAGGVARAKKTGAAAASTSSAPPNTASSKAMSAEARMRASIDAAKDKSLKAPGVPSASTGIKLNPQASAFRPSGALKTGPGGASTPAGAGRPSTASSAAGSGAKRIPTGGKPAFGKSMSGWDQLFGGISGLSTSSSSTPNKGTPTKPNAAGSKPGTPSGTAAAAASSTGIRPDPVLESASPADVQRLKEQANQDHLNTDECFDLLAHADIMVAFERSLYAEDRKLATRLRPAIWKAGTILQQGASQQKAQEQQQGAPQAAQ
ncbi:uncharacterized protein UBRO_05415 [Ustilago bromivora]|uniref:Uncharacterized protein n=1 Tax=Ustilago bromivora TaxID=307758 RepID=A0A1K0G707_9BASI|nr:uncharacterized protein UBRO_05415 [Ustilago bromivora]SYW74892.1 uncharacterized protein UBRO2_00302 [Ustilago bromivora]